MSSLPEKGEAAEAARRLTARVKAISAGAAEMEVETIEVNVRSGAIRGDTDPLMQIYGDLMDVGEVLADGALSLDAIKAERQSVQSGLISIYLQGVALGCLMERARWEKRHAA